MISDAFVLRSDRENGARRCRIIPEMFLYFKEQ